MLTFLFSLTGCMCRHENWLDADCVTPKTCEECGETEGAPLGHSWYAATCTAPKTCENCGETEGEPLVINDNDQLVGTWKCDTDLADQVNAAMGLS